MSILYRVINPVVKALLGSPLHGVMSSNTLVLNYRGRRSGKAYALPISYARSGDELLAFTARSGRWWRNFVPVLPVLPVESEGEGEGNGDGADAHVRVAGKDLAVRVQVATNPGPELQDKLNRFLQAVPRDARPAGVRMQDGVPDPADLAHAATRLVGLTFTIQTKQE